MQLGFIQNKIHEIRGQKVMLDYDLAKLYEVETKAFNQAVRRNISRFPVDFMFQLTKVEWNLRRSQSVTSSDDLKVKMPQISDCQLIEGDLDRSHSENNTSKFRKKEYLPYAFTEHGVTMLSSVLRSEKAINMGISVVRAFIELKQYVILQKDISVQLREIRDRLGEHDVQLSSIYDAIENLLDDEPSKETLPKIWDERERIGFRNQPRST
ncbi:MAG: ORF6N domain-containing protein [Bacteroidota bacterium]|nr:ORF6N domain-containing protein [Bacteroidota bacterium]MDP4213841.1 ORF6N domain-containing protein [Bacteroidota bacterium]MDP4250099.1 ORF6N domain-containing protein [Bacteroidota bacterium]